MDTRSDRRTRRSAGRRRIAVVSLSCVAGIVAAIIGASCANVEATNTRQAAPSVSPRVLRAIPLSSAREVVASVPTTTTTTRPAVNPDAGPPPANTGAGRRIIYCNSCQQVWLVDADEYVFATYRVSGRRGTPNPGEYHVFRKLDMGQSKSHPDLRLPFFVGFAWGPTTDIGFHGIPLRPDGSQIQDDSQLGIPLSAGCIREHQITAKLLYDWTPIDTLVVVTA